MRKLRLLLTRAHGSATKWKARVRGDRGNKSIHTQQVGTIPLSLRWPRGRVGARAYAGSVFLVVTVGAIFLWPQSPREAKSAPVAETPTIQVSGGIKPGFPNHTFRNPKLLFTWTTPIGISGAGWQEGAVQIVLRGPLNSPDVGAVERWELGAIASQDGSLSGSVTIPYTTSRGVFPPGLYEVSGVQFPFDPVPIRAVAADRINVCPATATIGPTAIGVDWGHERGARTGSFGRASPERQDPSWISVWDERPVEVYGMVEPTGSNLGDVSGTGLEANNQPAFVTDEDYPGAHYGHDVNIMLVPDKDYQWVLGTTNFYADSEHPDFRENGRIEIEWEFLNPGDQQRPEGGSEINYEQGTVGMPAFAMPTAGDRVYTVGRWILDCGHPEKGLRTEIHPPRLIATMRKHHTAVNLTIGDQEVPTRASQVDIYVSGHGGGANKFLDDLSRVLGEGGRIAENLDPTVYFADGPFRDQALRFIASDFYSNYKAKSKCSNADLNMDEWACDIRRFSFQLLSNYYSYLEAPAGPTGVLVGTPGPEYRGVNDMNYEFIVPLPTRPSGATALLVKSERHSQDTTTVKEVVDFINPDPATQQERVRVRLPYKGAEPSAQGGGIYARTLKLAWNAYQPPGNHLKVTLQSVNVLNASEGSGKSPTKGEWQIWGDIAGHWFYLTGLNSAFLAARAYTLNSAGQFLKTSPISVGATADVYLDDTEPLRLLTYGYDSDDFEGWFGSVYRNRYDLGVEMVHQALDRGGVFDSGNLDNDSLGGALFEGPVTINPGGFVFVTQPVILAPSARIKGEHEYFSEQNKGTRKYNALFTVALIPDVQPPPLKDITSIDGVSITRSGFVRTGFDNGMGHFVQRVTIRNNTGSDIQGPVYLVLDNLNRRLVTKPAGLTSNLAPFDRPFVVPKIVPDITFAPIFGNGDSLHVDLEFASPLESGITYTIQALAGNGLPP